MIAILSGCGATQPARRYPVAQTPVAHAAPQTRRGQRPHRPHAVALVTAEAENRLLIVDLWTGRETRRIDLPADPQYVAAAPGLAVASSPGAHAVTLLEGAPLRVAKVFHGFGTPRIAEISPDGQYAFVTDDSDGTLTAIDLSSAHITSTTAVGAGAHHFAVSPDEHSIWVALGEAASTITILTTCGTTCSPSPLADPGRPRVIGHFAPGFPAHDLSFSPGGRSVWITSASGPDVAVFRASDHRLLFRVSVGRPPQHIAVHGRYAYLTSGYGSTIEQVAANSGRVIRRAHAPYGSFELDVGEGYVVTASLLNGQLAIYTPQLRLLRTLALAPATRDLAISNQAASRAK